MFVSQLYKENILEQYRGTTILSCRRGNKVVIGGDGQVTMGQSIVLKGNARKVRRLYHGKVIAGFAAALRMHSRYLNVLKIN